MLGIEIKWLMHFKNEKIVHSQNPMQNPLVLMKKNKEEQTKKQFQKMSLNSIFTIHC